MKKALLIVSIFLSLILDAQSEKKSVAVANPYVQNLNITSEVAAKLIQLELIKQNKFTVYDEFDMKEALKGNSLFSADCYGINCLTAMGKELKADNIICGSFVGLSNKIAITLKWIDVSTGNLNKSVVREFDNQPDELQRMIEILISEMFELNIDNELLSRLKFNNDVITSNNVGKINNSGPRVGYALLTGTLNEYAKRPKSNGGLGVFPGVSMIGYQFEGQYVGTENFSALIEGIVNFAGMEQGVFIPSFAIMNGFRFGRSGWEIAFGPSFAFKKMSKGFFDSNNTFDKGKNYYFSESGWEDYINENYPKDTNYVGIDGSYVTPAEVSGNNNYVFEDNYDSKGDIKLGINWVFGFGRTFKAGALNIPVNVFYSSSRGGGMGGISVGFNVSKGKKKLFE